MADHPEIEARVLALVNAYGTEVALWPEAARTPAHIACLDAPSDALAAAIKEMDALDGLLDGLERPAPSSGLERAILQQAPRKGSVFGRSHARLGWRQWLPASGALASLAVGLVIGLAGPTPDSGLAEPTDEDALIYAALGFNDGLSAFDDMGPDNGETYGAPNDE